MAATYYNVYKIICSELCSGCSPVISLYEPYQSFSSAFITNKTVSIARDHRWSTALASRNQPNRPSSSSFSARQAQ